MNISRTICKRKWSLHVNKKVTCNLKRIMVYCLEQEVLICSFQASSNLTNSVAPFKWITAGRCAELNQEGITFRGSSVIGHREA